MGPFGKGKCIASGLAVAVWLLTACPALSEEGRRRVFTPGEFGITEEVIYNLNPSDFQVRDGGWPSAELSNDIFIGVASGSTTVTLAAPIHLPAGVRITSVRVYHYDTHQTSNPSVGLYRNETFGVHAEIVSFVMPNFSSGHFFADGTVDTDKDTIDNETYHYSVLATLHRDVGNPFEEERLLRVRIRYVRQVSPAPLSATFTDVSTAHPHHRFVEALAAAGITAGCGGGNYCPDAPITRGQMAVFLSTALGLHWPVSP